MSLMVICIVCPKSCEMQIVNGEPKGFKCKRGYEFAQQEIKNPIRVLTTTISFKENDEAVRIPVKTTHAVPFKKMKKYIAAVKNCDLSQKPMLGQRLMAAQCEWVVTG